jgi:outer membrane biogenesis lipoprotein LolB
VRFSTGLVGAILLGGLCAVQVRAINEPPTVQMTFHSATDKTMKVQFIGQGRVGYDIQNIAAGASGSYTFTTNPHVVTVQVSGCLAQSQMMIAKMYTRVYSKVATGIGSDCRLFAPVDTPQL